MVVKTSVFTCILFAECYCIVLAELLQIIGIGAVVKVNFNVKQFFIRWEKDTRRFYVDEVSKLCNEYDLLMSPKRN